jgi:hypothetical protein
MIPSLGTGSWHFFAILSLRYSGIFVAYKMSYTLQETVHFQRVRERYPQEKSIPAS